MCFKYIGDSQSWNESENTCRGHRGNLAALTSLAELSFAKDLCSEPMANNECWVGGRSTNTSTASNWTWSDNTYNWNETLVTVVTPDLKSSCTNSSCFNNYKDDSASLCTILTNRTISLLANRCNISHPSICMLVTGWRSLLKPLIFSLLLN